MTKRRFNEFNAYTHKIDDIKHLYTNSLIRIMFPYISILFFNTPLLHGLGIVRLLCFYLLFLHSKIRFSTATSNEKYPKMQCQIVGWFVGRLNHIQRSTQEKQAAAHTKKKKRNRPSNPTNNNRKRWLWRWRWRSCLPKKHRTEKFTERNVKLKSICCT